MDEEAVREEWRPFALVAYEVSNLGRVRRAYSCGPWPTGGKHRVLRRYVDRWGYPRVQLRQERFVHLLVAEAFLGPRPPGYVANHKNGDKSDASVANLEWVTRSQNQLHALAIGLSDARGQTHGKAKLSDEQVREIRQRYTGRWGQQCELAREFDVSQALVGQIVRGEVWTHLDPDYQPKSFDPGVASTVRGRRKSNRGARHGMARLDDRKVRAARRRYAAGRATIEQLAEQYGVGRQIMRNVLFGKTWKHVTA